MQAQLNIQNTSITEYYTNLKYAAAEVNTLDEKAVTDF